MENNDEVHCPRCNSTQIQAMKKGFSGKKAVVGAVLTGGIGILAGTIGSNKVLLNCLKCGKQFKPGEVTVKPDVKWNKVDSDIDYMKRLKANKAIAKVFAPIFVILSAILLLSEDYVIGSISTIMGLFFLFIAFKKLD
jgi:DNA-directed RNA polymerase subunit RPC12/RpoP